ncbi:MAG: putative lipid II flippase FtsW [Porticoccaceae bacterium]|nr:MAG: putative lipid II flippase FtsW [Porticoccaceae bacterium]
MNALRFVRLPEGVDLRLLLAAAAIASLGLVMVASSSADQAAQNLGDPLYYARRHLVYLAIAAAVAWLALQVPLATWRRAAPLFVAGTLAALLAVLLVGREVNGARRWLVLGPFNLQVAELAKVAVVVHLAAWLAAHPGLAARHWRSVVRPLAPVAAMGVLLLAQPDFGSTVVIAATAAGLLFLGGLPLRVFAGFLALGAAALAALAWSSPYRLERLVSFLDPWADQFDSGYQLVQSLIAFGRGGWLGVGLGNGVQKLFYLPEAHTDFVMAVVAEELGLLGVVAVVGLFGLLVGRVFAIAGRAVRRQDWFAAHLAHGVGILIAGQAFINLGVTAGLLPTKGLTLPLVSYGGSSLLATALLLALAARVGIEMDERHWAPGRSAGG